MNINDVEIGSVWEDSWGIRTFKNNDKSQGQIIGSMRKVTIIAKTSNSICYSDTKRFISWETEDDFFRFEKQIQKIRFIKVV